MMVARQRAFVSPFRCIGVVALVTLAAAQADERTPAQSLLDTLNQTISWYRRVSAQAQTATEPADVLFAGENVHLARQVVGFAFDAARAQAALWNDPRAQPQPDRPAAPTLLSRAADATAAAQQAQAQVDSLQRQLDTARPRAQTALRDQIAEAKSELALAQAREQTLKAMTGFMTQAGSGAGGLVGQIDELERSVPEIRAQRGSSQPAPAPNAPAAHRSQPSGVVGLFGEVFSLGRKLRDLHETLTQTAAVRSGVDKIRAPLLADVRATLQQGDQLSAAPDTTAADILADRRKKLDAITDHFRKLSAAVVPLGNEAVLLDSVRANLTEWRESVDSEYDASFRTLLVHLGLLIAALGIIFSASDFWRRATFRYIADFRKRQQSLLARRIVVAVAVALTVVFSLVSELGSLATFAGFITAGLAVALQNVILSVAAYFFLIGKYGIRVGDRVQIGTVTGDVMDIGLVRLHVMEVRPDGLATGRVVVFSNAVVFSNSNFFKQLPGSSFTWHEVKLTLAAQTDYRLAEKRIMSAVNGIFEQYRAAVDQQHSEVEQNVVLNVGQARPESRLHLTEAGLEMLIRYPVPLDQAAAIDDRMTRALLAAIDSEPRLQLVGSSNATLQPAPAPAQ